MMLLDYLRVFCRISGKMDENSKIWAISGVLRRGVGIPRSSVGPSQGVACPCRGVAERGLRQALSTLRRSYCSQHGNLFVLLLFSILLFRGLDYWTNENPISI